jgi:hypothetical protein
MKIKYYNLPCGIHTSDPDHVCKFFEFIHSVSQHGVFVPRCNIDIEDPEGETPFDLREKELEEFEIMELYQDNTDEEREYLVSKMHKCYLHVNSDEVIDAIQLYRKSKK